MKKRLQECKMPFPSSDSKMGQPGWGRREASSGGGEGLVAEAGGGSRAGGHWQRFRFPSRPVPGAACWDWCPLGGLTGRGQWHARLPARRGGGWALGILLLCLRSSALPELPVLTLILPMPAPGPGPSCCLPRHGLCQARVPAKQVQTDCDLSAVSGPAWVWGGWELGLYRQMETRDLMP